jgi:hypothetical protein
MMIFIVLLIVRWVVGRVLHRRRALWLRRRGRAAQGVADSWRPTGVHGTIEQGRRGGFVGIGAPEPALLTKADLELAVRAEREQAKFDAKRSNHQQLLINVALTAISLVAGCALSTSVRVPKESDTPRRHTLHLEAESERISVRIRALAGEVLHGRCAGLIPVLSCWELTMPPACR